MQFYKYQGAGNDFIMVDQRNRIDLQRTDTAIIEKLCDRRFGIGADGLILLQGIEGYDFEMIYFNADGRESSMCGNGGRCIAAFAADLGIVKDYCRFIAVDGPHEAHILEKGGGLFHIELKMSDLPAANRLKNAYFLNTGSPHYVSFEPDIDTLDVVTKGREVRYDPAFAPGGVNVNFIARTPEGLSVRTYERGVEDETLACGTGVTAAALADHLDRGGNQGAFQTAVQARGGALSVRFHCLGDGRFEDIWLCGPAQKVFYGEI